MGRWALHYSLITSETLCKKKLSNKVALITGSSRGLGAAIAKKLGAHGAKVAVNYLGDAEKNNAQKVQYSITQQGGTCEIFHADVTDHQEITALCSNIQKTLGQIDILVLNATGPQPNIKIEDLNWQDMLCQLNFLVKSPLLLVQQVIPHMKKNQYGRIINIGSEVFELGVPERSNYVSAKGAQLGLTRCWSQELGPHQITVNLIAPGWIPTERHTNNSDKMKQDYANQVPMKHMGEANDIAETVLFFGLGRC